MSIVKVNIEAIELSIKLLMNSLLNIEKAEVELTKNYRELGGIWGDAKYKELGTIIYQCNQALYRMRVEVTAALTSLKEIIKYLREYENIQLISSSNLNCISGFNYGEYNQSSFRRIVEQHRIEEDLAGANPNFHCGEQWQVNCQRCVPTYEMRRRGFDVTAKPKTLDNDYLSYHPFDVWNNPNVISCRDNGQREIENFMSSWGDGARAQIVVVWAGTNSGHTFIGEQVNGDTRFVDPQTGEEDVSYYFENVEIGYTQLCRVDNLEPTNRINDCSEEVNYYDRLH